MHCRGYMIALAVALLAGAGCRGEPAPGAVQSGDADVGTTTGAAGGDPGLVTGAGGATDTAGASVPPGERPEWDSDRARAIWADARVRGVTFRGIGQEPGWHLELFEGDSMVFVTDYGERRARAAWPAPQVEGATGRVLLDGAAGAVGRLVVSLERRACHDSMSGQPFDFTVTVTLGGVVHDGCGRQL